MILKTTEDEFLTRPHATLLGLSVPVLFSLIAEPLTGLVDTAFVARLGAVPLAALGVGTTVLSAIFWAFNFLGIGTQTDVARWDGAAGTGQPARTAAAAARTERDATMLQALIVAAALGTLAALLLWPLTPFLVQLLGAVGPMARSAELYTQVRWMGAPAIVITIAGFGALRGLRRMREPLFVALALNAVNIALDASLIPHYGIAGAAWATVAAQWLGATAVIWLVLRQAAGSVAGPPRRALSARRLGRLFRAGRDIVLRTASLTLFIVLATREATRLGADQGAVHQAVRQFWIFTALFLDTFAISGQSLVAFVSGVSGARPGPGPGPGPDSGRQLDLEDSLAAVRRVARVVLVWSGGVGAVLALVMWLGAGPIGRLLVPTDALWLFPIAWIPALLFQPLNALAFGTDGVLWGTSDFAYLRNVTLTATVVGLVLMYGMLALGHLDLGAIWLVTGVWVAVRAVLGLVRIFAGHAGLNRPDPS